MCGGLTTPACHAQAACFLPTPVARPAQRPAAAGESPQRCQLQAATYLWRQHVSAARGVDSIVGRVILCHDKQFKKLTTALGPAADGPRFFQFQPVTHTSSATKAPKTTAAEVAAPVVWLVPFTPIWPIAPRLAYLMEKVDDATGEVAQVPMFRYLPGHPRQVRFDAKAGQFNINGTVPLGSSLSFIPLAWRVFQDDILDMSRKPWAELFFADDKGAICAVLLHGYSAENLYRLIEPSFLR